VPRLNDSCEGGRKAEERERKREREKACGALRRGDRGGEIEEGR
jgi:hypothetical protein